MAKQCLSCGTITHVAVSVCPDCGSTQLGAINEASQKKGLLLLIVAGVVLVIALTAFALWLFGVKFEFNHF